MSELVLRILEWDSAFFGIMLADLPENMIRHGVDNIELEAERNGIDLVQCCLDIANKAEIEVLENHGFKFADLRMEYIVNLNRRPNGMQYFLADASDVQELRTLAQDAYTSSRYHHPAFPSSRVREFYVTWTEKAVLGILDDVCIIEREADKIVGYVTAKLLATKAHIGLIAVDRNFRGRGVGSRLLKALFSWIADHGVNKLTVATQGENISAQNLYIRNSFLLSGVKAWFYRWQRGIHLTQPFIQG